MRPQDAPACHRKEPSIRARRTLKAATAALIASASGVALGVMPASAHVSIVTYRTTFTAGSTNVIYFRVHHGGHRTLQHGLFGGRAEVVVDLLDHGEVLADGEHHGVS